jgi:hypothetical protein
MMTNRPKKFLLFLVLLIVGLPLFVFVGGTVVQLLWNWLLPPLLGVKAITFWQGIGLLALSRILFGGFGGGHRGSSWSRRHREDREQWHRKMAERFGEPSPPGIV